MNDKTHIGCPDWHPEAILLEGVVNDSNARVVRAPKLLATPATPSLLTDVLVVVPNIVATPEAVNVAFKKHFAVAAVAATGSLVLVPKAQGQFQELVVMQDHTYPSIP